MILVILLFSIVYKGQSAFWQTYIAIDVNLESVSTAQLNKVNFRALSRNAIGSSFPNVKSRQDKKQLYKLFSNGIEYEVQNFILKNKSLVGSSLRIWVKASADIDMLRKDFIDRNGVALLECSLL